MDFLVHMTVSLPVDMTESRESGLRAEESMAAAELAREGVLVRLWRDDGDGTTWGLWRSLTADSLEAHLRRLPLRPYMSVTVSALVAHTNDPIARPGEMPTMTSSIAGEGTMTAVLKMRNGEDSVGLGRVPIPRPSAGEVLVEVHGAGVCGTDLHIAHDDYPTRPPVVMGHEVAGLVTSVGEGVDPAWIGARVVCETHHQVCGCEFCRDGRRNLCLNKTSMGSFVDGGFASHVRVRESLIHRIPDRVGDHAAALSEPLACVCHCLLDPPIVNLGDRVLVTGPGPMGLLAAQVARACGGDVTVVGLAQDSVRLGVAQNLGFRIAHAAEQESYEVVLECSGSAGGATTALEAARRGGRYVAVGIFGAPATLPVDRILYKELTVTSGFAATPRSWQRALRLLEDGAIDLDALISSVQPLGAWKTVLGRLANSDGMKIVFDPRLADMPEDALAPSPPLPH